MSLVLPRSNPKQTLCLHSANQRRNYVEAADPPCAHPRRTLPAMWSRSHDSAAATSTRSRTCTAAPLMQAADTVEILKPC
jgi:hypothetical protein